MKLNASTPVSPFGRAMEFLSAAAEDYGRFCAAATGELPVSVPSGVWVYLAAGGKTAPLLECGHEKSPVGLTVKPAGQVRVGSTGGSSDGSVVGSRNLYQNTRPARK